jgi:biotin transport system substrate-specific component
MIQENALIPQMIIARGNKVLDNTLSIVVGVVMMSLLAQIAIPLPWTPVPITGQTFGVAFTALLWGRNRALASVLAYLSIGALGAPVFALGKSGLMMGPTMGYLVGMVFASYWMGLLSDLGWTRTFGRTWVAAISGSVITFAFGLLVLSAFIPAKALFVSGLLPFLPGDAIKCLLAAFTVTQAQRTFRK